MNTRDDRHEDHLYLPDLCNVRRVFAVVVAAELLAYVLSLSPSTGPEGRWQRWMMASLFIQWVALSSTALLCMARRLMRCWSQTATTLYSFGLVLAVTVLVSEAAYWIGRHIQLFPRGDWHGQFLIRNLTISAIVTVVTLRYFYVQHQLRRNTQAEAYARLQALQARVRPHFLFNSMNTIASLTRSDPALAEEVVEDLADLFRVNLADARTRIPLAEELALTRRYLHIERLRLGERLAVDEDLAALPADAAIPMLTLQPLVENAVYHGIEPLAQGGTIRISGRREAGGAVAITVANPVPEAAPPRRDGHHLALDNVRQRLAAHYGKAGKLAVEETADCYRVTVTLPYERATT